MASATWQLQLADKEESRWHFESVVRLIASRRQEPPRGMSRSKGRKGTTLSVSKRAFSIAEGVLTVDGAPSTRIESTPQQKHGWNQSALVIRVSPEMFTVELVMRRKEGKRNKKGSGAGGSGYRIHHPAAMFLTRGVKPRTFSGGLPSLGKRSK